MLHKLLTLHNKLHKIQHYITAHMSVCVREGAAGEDHVTTTTPVSQAEITNCPPASRIRHIWNVTEKALLFKFGTMQVPCSPCDVRQLSPRVIAYKSKRDRQLPSRSTTAATGDTRTGATSACALRKWSEYRLAFAWCHKLKLVAIKSSFLSELSDLFHWLLN